MMPGLIGRLAATNVSHPFMGRSSSCVHCFGWRDDPRHWLPPRGQAKRDRAVTAHEDRWKVKAA